MRISAADWCFRERCGLPPADYYARLAKLGISGVEMVAPEHYALARAHGLALVTQGAHDLNRGLNHVDHHDMLVPRIRAQINDARREGIAKLIVFSGRRDGLSEEAGADACVRGLAQVAADAERAGVTLLFEVLNEFDHPDQQCSTLGFAAKVVRAVDSPHVRILYDLYHGSRMGEDVLGFDLELLPLIGHLHVAEHEGRACPKPGGRPDYPAIVRRLSAAGYAGWWGIEFLPGSDVFAEIAQARDLLQAPARAAIGG